MYVSMALLLLSTAQETGLIGSALKAVWLISIGLLTVLNLGAAFGAYVAAASLFAVLSFDGWGSIVQRPDNYALLVVAAGLGFRILASRPLRLWNWSTVVIGGFVAYALVQSAMVGLLTRGTIAGYMRMLGLPMLMFLLLAHYGLEARELRALVRSLLVLGVYMALVSIAERVGWHGLIIPAWIADPSITTVDPSRTDWIHSGRSGGPLMQAEYNGLALTMILCVAILAARVMNVTNRWMGVVAAVFCLIGIFFTYTRAAWVACVLASLVLLWRPAAVPGKSRLLRFGVLTVGVGLVVALALLPETFARQRIGDKATVGLRLNLWKAGVAMAADRPLTGRGFGMFPAHVEDYQHKMTLESPGIGRATVAHNMALSMLVEFGAIGLVLYAAALVAVWRRAVRAAVRLWAREGAVWVGVFTGVYVFQLQFMILGDPATNHLFFGMMGAIAGIQVRGSEARFAP
jgi:O-antigen ligase